MLGYRVVTSNERHFRAVPGLQIENWSKNPG
jgi:predicted nucleic acid-binding protein